MILGQKEKLLEPITEAEVANLKHGGAKRRTIVPPTGVVRKLGEAIGVDISASQRRLGIATVFVMHDQGAALIMLDRIVVMREGRIEQIGTPGEIYERPVTRFVESANAVMVVRPERLGLCAAGRAEVRQWARASGTRAYLGAPRAAAASGRRCAIAGGRHGE